MEEALRWYTRDFSTHRYLSIESLPLPTSLEEITTKTIPVPEQVLFRVELKQPWSRAIAQGAQPDLDNGDEQDWYFTRASRRIYLESSCDCKREPGRPIQMLHAGETLKQALQTAEPVLRRLTPFSRALRGTSRAPYKGTEIEVASSIYNSGKAGLLYTDHWSIVTPDHHPPATQDHLT